MPQGIRKSHPRQLAPFTASGRTPKSWRQPNSDNSMLRSAMMPPTRRSRAASPWVMRPPVARPDLSASYAPSRTSTLTSSVPSAANGTTVPLTALPSTVMATSFPLPARLTSIT